MGFFAYATVAATNFCPITGFLMLAGGYKSIGDPARGVNGAFITLDSVSFPDDTGKPVTNTGLRSIKICTTLAAGDDDDWYAQANLGADAGLSMEWQSARNGCWRHGIPT